MAFQKLNLDPKVFQKVYQEVLMEQHLLKEEAGPNDLENLEDLYNAMIQVKVCLEALRESDDDSIADEADEIYEGIFEHLKKINLLRARHDVRHRQRIMKM